jgi:hypothetical protein
MNLIRHVACIALLFCAGCAASSTQLLAPARPPIDPSEVQIYTAPPAKFQQIALIDATSGTSFFHGSTAGQDAAIQKLKLEAAKVGANGVLLTLVGDRPNGSIGVGVGGGGVTDGRGSATAVSGSASGGLPLVTNGAQGVAIYVIKK